MSLKEVNKSLIQLSDKQDALRESFSRLDRYVGAISSLNYDPVVGTVVDETRKHIDSMRSVLSECVLLVNSSFEKMPPYQNGKRFSVRYSNGDEEDGLCAPNVDELKRVCEANGDRIVLAKEFDELGEFVRDYKFEVPKEDKKEKSLVNFKEFYDNCPDSIKKIIDDEFDPVNFDNKATDL
jgi:hypothetical protein